MTNDYVEQIEKITKKIAELNSKKENFKKKYEELSKKYDLVESNKELTTNEKKYKLLLIEIEIKELNIKESGIKHEISRQRKSKEKFKIKENCENKHISKTEASNLINIYDAHIEIENFNSTIETLKDEIELYQLNKQLVSLELKLKKISQDDWRKKLNEYNQAIGLNNDAINYTEADLQDSFKKIIRLRLQYDKIKGVIDQQIFDEKMEELKNQTDYTEITLTNIINYKKR